MGTTHLKRIGWWFVLWIIIPVLLISCVERKLQEKDKPLLVTIHDLKPFGYKSDNLRHRGESKRIRYFDGSLSFEYEFQSPTGSEDFVYMATTVNLDVTPVDAALTYRANKIGLGIGVKAGDLKYKIKPDFFKWGDESEFAYLESENEVVGNVFNARLANRTYFLIISGFYFDNAKQWAEFITPKLEYLRVYKP